MIGPHSDKIFSCDCILNSKKRTKFEFATLYLTFLHVYSVRKARKCIRKKTGMWIIKVEAWRSFYLLFSIFFQQNTFKIRLTYN